MFLTTTATVAHAAFPCTWGEGEYQVGEDNGTPLCEQGPVAGDDSGDDSASTPQSFDDPEGDALTAKKNAYIVGIFAALQATQDRAKLEQKLASDPVYKRLKAGYWEFLPRPKGLRKGDGCAATFINLNGGVTIAGPKGNFRQAALTFWGGNIPPTKTEKVIKVTLSQSGDDPPETVQVTHAAMANGKLGSVTFTVPTAQALVGGMLDKNGFAVAYKQKPWHRITWTKGNAARQYMTKCLAGK
ncbi:MAG: hypothetical protein GYA66_11940 [Phyllobacteriaceae bacterium]|nr:hypothetical protein [Phyllobacteriaceae bacterium]